MPAENPIPMKGKIAGCEPSTPKKRRNTVVLSRRIIPIVADYDTLLSSPNELSVFEEIEPHESKRNNIRRHPIRIIMIASRISPPEDLTPLEKSLIN